MECKDNYNFVTYRYLRPGKNGTYFENIKIVIIKNMKMKKTIYLTLILTLVLISCESTPLARFSTETIEPEVGQEILFMNSSDNAKQFEWDFGDGYGSYEASPIHIFTGTGTFEVILKVTSKSGLTDEASLVINVKIPTLLEIEVLEYYDLYSVPDASVYLYGTLQDWDNAQNDISQGFTDANGYVVFSHLDPFVYYVDVWEQNHDNYSLRTEDVGFIRTDEIIPNHINRFTAYVDYVEHAKGAAKGTRRMIIKKLERKVTDKGQISSDAGTENWQEVYNRRIIKK